MLHLVKPNKTLPPEKKVLVTMNNAESKLWRRRLIAPMFRPDGVGTVTQEEKEKFAEIKERLRVQLEYQLTNFRYEKNSK